MASPANKVVTPESPVSADQQYVNPQSVRLLHLPDRNVRRKRSAATELFTEGGRRISRLSFRLLRSQHWSQSPANRPGPQGPARKKRSGAPS